MMTKDDAIKWLDNLTQDIGQMRFQYLWPYAQAIAEIGQMIEDTPDIVRCKDCKYCDGDDNCDEPVRWCEKRKGEEFFVTDEFFCAVGERKESKSTTEDDDPEVIKQRRIIEIRDEISKIYEELEKLTTIEHI